MITTVSPTITSPPRRASTAPAPRASSSRTHHRPRSLTAVRVLAAGEALLAPSVTRRLIAEVARRPEPARPPSRSLDAVTDRELDVLGLIARGSSNTEIAEHLRLSLATVKTHIGRLLAKLHARDRAQLVIVAYDTWFV